MNVADIESELGETYKITISSSAISIITGKAINNKVFYNPSAYYLFIRSRADCKFKGVKSM